MSLEVIALLSESQRQSYADVLAAQLLECSGPGQPTTTQFRGKFHGIASSDDEVAARVARFYHLAPIQNIHDRARIRAVEAI